MYYKGLDFRWANYLCILFSDSSIMIDAISYRISIGNFNASCSSFTLKTPPHTQTSKTPTTYRQLIYLFSYIVFTFYSLLYQLSMISDTARSGLGISASCSIKLTNITIHNSKASLVPILLLCLNALKVIIFVFYEKTGTRNLFKLYQYIRYKYSKTDNCMYKNFRKFHKILIK